MVESLADMLECEHREIDREIEAFMATSGERDAETLRRAIAALRCHIYVEEELIFPPLRGHELFAPLLVMLREHGQLWDSLNQIERELGTDGSGLAELCRQLLIQLQHHNLKEERIIYPQADGALAPAEAAECGIILRGGELPAGWVCAKASR